MNRRPLFDAFDLAGVLLVAAIASLFFPHARDIAAGVAGVGFFTLLYIVKKWRGA